MPLPARKFELEDSMEARIARLEAHTDNIQSNVQLLREEMKAFSTRTEARFGELDKKIDILAEKVDKKIDTLAEKVDAKFEQLRGAIESMKIGRVWDRVWMLLSMGALLAVMARGFKWI